MPILTLPNAQDGPTIQILVAVSEPRFQALAQVGQPIPAPQPARFLVDTGASITAIDPSIIQPLGVPSTGTASMMTPSTGGTPHSCNLFDGSLVIRYGHGLMHILSPCVAVAEAVLIHQGIAGLIGRDVLSGCLLTYNGASGYYILAMWFPSPQVSYAFFTPHRQSSEIHVAR